MYNVYEVDPSQPNFIAALGISEERWKELHSHFKTMLTDTDGIDVAACGKKVAEIAQNDNEFFAVSFAIGGWVEKYRTGLWVE